MELSFTPQGRALQLLTARTDGAVARAEITTVQAGKGSGNDRRHLTDPAQTLRDTAGPEVAAPPVPGEPDQDDRPHRAEGRNHGETRRLLDRMAHLGRALSRLQSGDGRGPRFVMAGGFVAGGGLALSIRANRVDGLYTDYKAVGAPGASPHDAALADAVSIQAREVRSVDTAGGNDALAIEAQLVDGIQTGNESDALAIRADIVRNIQTDLAEQAGVPPDGLRAGADAVAIAARLVEAVSTGGGNDAIAVQAVAVLGVDAGSGDDAIAILAGLVGGVSGGDGNDAIAIRAGVVGAISGGEGNDSIAVQAGVVGAISGGEGNDAITVDAFLGLDGRAEAPEWRSLAEMSVTARLAEVAAAGIQVDGGAGADAISLHVATGLGVSGGTGDDLIAVAGGTVAIGFAAGDGNDRVLLMAGAEAVVQLAPGVTDYSVVTDGDALVVTVGEGSIRFEGLGQSGAIGIRTWQGEVTLLHNGQSTGLDRLV